MKKIVKFLREVRSEVKKVNWPTRKETAKYTLTVILATIVVSAYLGALDAFFYWIIDSFIL